jgi:hypothetical protein
MSNLLLPNKCTSARTLDQRIEPVAMTKESAELGHVRHEASDPVNAPSESSDTSSEGRERADRDELRKSHFHDHERVDPAEPGRHVGCMDAAATLAPPWT